MQSTRKNQKYNHLPQRKRKYFHRLLVHFFGNNPPGRTSLSHTMNNSSSLVCHVEKLQALGCRVLNSLTNRNPDKNLLESSLWTRIAVMISTPFLDLVDFIFVWLFPPLDPIDHAIYQNLISPFYVSLASNIGNLIQKILVT